MVFNSHDNAYKLINILNELWLESARYFKYDYSIDKLCDILYDISNNSQDILLFNKDEIISKIKRMEY